MPSPFFFKIFQEFLASLASPFFHIFIVTINLFPDHLLKFTSWISNLIGRICITIVYSTELWSNTHYIKNLIYMISFFNPFQHTHTFFQRNFLISTPFKKSYFFMPSNDDHTYFSKKSFPDKFSLVPKTKKHFIFRSI